MTIEGRKPNSKDYPLLINTLKRELEDAKLGSVKLLAFSDAIAYYFTQQRYHETSENDNLRAAINLDAISRNVRDRGVRIEGYESTFYKLHGLIEKINISVSELPEDNSPDVEDLMNSIRSSKIRSND